MNISNTNAAFKEDELFEKAYNYYLSNQPKKAIDFFDMFLQEYPNSTSKDAALFWKARSLVKINKKDESVSIFMKVIEEFPSSFFRNFAESELENIKSSDMSGTVTQPAFKSRETVISPDKISDNNSKVEKMLANDREQKEQLAEYQKKLQLFEKTVLKADEDKNICLESLETEKKKTESLSQKTKSLTELTGENQRLKEEIKSKEDKNYRLSHETISKTVEDKNICLESLESEKKKTEALSQKTKSLAELTRENERLKEEIRSREDKKPRPSQESISRIVEENITCLESLETEKKKTESFSQKTKSLDDLVGENQRLKEELKIKEAKMQIEDQKHKEDVGLLKDYKSFETKVNECDIKMKNFIEENRKNEKIVAELSKARDALAEKLKSSEKIEKEQKERLLSLQMERRSKDTDHIETNTNKDKTELLNNVKNLQKEVSVLSEKLKQFEAPILEIGGNQYTAAQVIDEYLIATEVENKLKQKTISWKKGNAYDDFLMEKILLNKAQEKKIKRDAALYNMLIKQYSFSEKEKAYLSRYLTIDKLISKISGNIYVKESNIRKYYEKNKQEFLVSPGKEVINVLSVDYNTENEIERNLLIIDIQNKADKGHSLENIYAKQPALISLKQYGFSMSPDWIKEEANRLKKGEISSIISRDNKYIMIQPWESMPTYEKYGEVHYMIRKRLLEKSRANDHALNNWFREIQNEDRKTENPAKTNIVLQAEEEPVKPKTKSVAIKKKTATKTKKNSLRKQP